MLWVSITTVAVSVLPLNLLKHSVTEPSHG